MSDTPDLMQALKDSLVRRAMTADRDAVVEAMARAIEWPDEYACACEGMDCADPQAHREQWRAEEAAAALDAALPLIVGPLRELHRPRVEKFVTGDCAAEECGHDDECPTTDIRVCRECWSIAEDVHGIYWAEGNGPKDVVLWPCATAVALDALLGGQA